ncbi:MAG: hypothetical protein KF700_11655, partial [Hyphomonadaceae bacterium]|nr:hypothetical protein [Hyphomonadaceae bacterium]
MFALVLALASCAAAGPPPAPLAPAPAASGPQMPREIRAGLADMVVQAVEAEPPEAEVAEAVAALVRAAPACAPWPALWIEGGERRSYFLVRYDLMTRDWGEEVAAEARA